MTPEEATKEAHLKRMAIVRVYQNVFCENGKLTEQSQRVLEELDSFALVDRPSFRPPNWDTHQAAFEEGMRNVILHIRGVLAGIEEAGEQDEDEEPEQLKVKR